MIFFGDLHLDEYRMFSTILENGFNSRLMEQIKVDNQVVQKIEELGEENVIFLGDLINSFAGSLPKVIYNAAYLTCRLIAEKANLYLIIGNHDLFRNMHIFQAFAEIPNVFIVSSPVTERIEGYQADLIPWDCALPIQKGDILAGHLSVLGSWENASKHKSEEGIHSTSMFGYKHIFLGHFHDAQPIEVPGAQTAMYTGSIMQINLAGSVMERGLYRLKDDKVEFFPIKSPQIKEITLETPEAAKEFLDRGYNEIDYFKITVRHREIELPTFDHKVIVEYDLAPSAPELRFANQPDENIIETIENFIDQSNTALPKDKIKEKLKEIL